MPLLIFVGHTKLTMVTMAYDLEVPVVRKKSCILLK